MGEKEVGGAEILKSLHDNEPDFDVDQTSVYKRLHFARAFAWLVAKDHSSLLILKASQVSCLLKHVLSKRINFSLSISRD